MCGDWGSGERDTELVLWKNTKLLKVNDDGKAMMSG